MGFVRLRLSLVAGLTAVILTVGALIGPTIALALPPAPSNAKPNVICSPSSLDVHSATSCTASATGDSVNSLAGIIITFSSDSPGAFSPADTCSLAGDANAASCSVSFTPSAAGNQKVTASFPGDAYYKSATASTTISVNKLTLTVSNISANNKVYDGTTTATLATSNYTLNGVYSGDDVSLNTDPATYSATFSDANVGTNKSVTVSGLKLTGADAGNYSLTQPTGLTASITPLAITGSFTAADKVYDGTTDATVLTRTLNGVLAADAGNVLLTGGTASFADKNVGDAKTVTASGMILSGSAAGNYSLASVATTTANITLLAITGSFTVADKVYDGTTSANITSYSLNGAIAGDNVSLSGGTASFDNANVGSDKTVTLSGMALIGSDASNYTLTSVNTTTAAITIGTNNTAVTLSTITNGDGSISATIPTLTVNSSPSASGVSINIPAGTTITAPAGSNWTGYLQLPEVVPATGTAPIGYLLGDAVIEVGSANFELLLNQAATITLTGVTGSVGYKEPGSGTWILIKSVCAGNYVSPNLPSGANECAISDGHNTKIVTNHFTQFAAFTKSNTYIVQPGDTMFGIAYKFGLTLAQLESFNPQAGHPVGNYDLILPGDLLYVGRAVLIASAEGGQTLGENTGGLVGSALSTTSPSSGQVKAAEGITRSTTAVSSELKWYWWLLIALGVSLAIGSYYAYEARKLDSQ